MVHFVSVLYLFDLKLIVLNFYWLFFTEGFWFQKEFKNPELAGQFVRNRPPPQVWGGGIVDFVISNKKKKAVMMGTVDKCWEGVWLANYFDNILIYM